jgi:hypothetical protein
VLLTRSILCRRKTLLWLDDNPDRPENARIRRGIPGHGISKPVAGLGEHRLSLAADNKDIALEDQVDVTLFTSVDAFDAFMCHPSQQKFVKYPPSLFRIVTNRRLFVGPSGLCARIRVNPTWQSAFPSIMVFHGDCDDGLDALKGHPTLKITRDAGDCSAFVSFQSALVAAVKAMDGTAAAPSQVQSILRYKNNTTRAMWARCISLPALLKKARQSVRWHNCADRL